MSNYTIIDRRANPKGKNLSNRQRFLDRAKEWVKKKVQEKSISRDITNTGGESIHISGDGISEPTFDYDYSKGIWDRVLPGNKEYVVGDTIKRDDNSGRSKKASNSGEGTDSFEFILTADEYLNILFDDLELPDLIKESEAAAIMFERRRTGFSTSGSPNNLDLEKSLKNALGRKIALGFPLSRKIEELQEQLLLATDDERLLIEEEIRLLRLRRGAIAYIDQVDIRYKRHSLMPIPNSQAVVFCLMDISGSMGQNEKDTAKRFFLLLYLFLQRKYEKVDIIFVKHTTDASECTENEFFYGQETGGTIVSSGVKCVNDIIQARYPTNLWNIYTVQASDGDNYESDNILLSQQLELLIPKCQFYVYNEVVQNIQQSLSLLTTNVHDVMSKLQTDHLNLAIVKITSVAEVISAFRKIFAKKLLTK